jgi:hypothetical protein
MKGRVDMWSNKASKQPPGEEGELGGTQQQQPSAKQASRQASSRGFPNAVRMGWIDYLMVGPSQGVGPLVEPRVGIRVVGGIIRPSPLDCPLTNGKGARAMETFQERFGFFGCLFAPSKVRQTRTGGQAGGEFGGEQVNVLVKRVAGVRQPCMQQQYQELRWTRMISVT